MSATTTIRTTAITSICPRWRMPCSEADGFHCAAIGGIRVRRLDREGCRDVIDKRGISSCSFRGYAIAAQIDERQRRRIDVIGERLVSTNDSVLRPLDGVTGLPVNNI